MMLYKGRVARWGLLGGGLFMLVLMPLGLDVLPNVLLSLTFFYLARQDFPASVWDMLRRRPAPAMVRP
jgi:hypothetical protein